MLVAVRVLQFAARRLLHVYCNPSRLFATIIQRLNSWQKDTQVAVDASLYTCSRGSCKCVAPSQGSIKPAYVYLYSHEGIMHVVTNYVRAYIHRCVYLCVNACTHTLGLVLYNVCCCQKPIVADWEFESQLN